MCQSLYSIGAVTILMLLSSCGSTKYEPLAEAVSVEKVSYKKHIRPLIDKYCISCHSGQMPMRGIDFTTHNVLKVHAMNGNLLPRISSEGSPMPPIGMMPSAEIETLKNWAKANYPED